MVKSSVNSHTYLTAGWFELRYFCDVNLLFNVEEVRFDVSPVQNIRQMCALKEATTILLLLTFPLLQPYDHRM